MVEWNRIKMSSSVQRSGTKGTAGLDGTDILQGSAAGGEEEKNGGDFHDTGAAGNGYAGEAADRESTSRGRFVKNVERSF